MRWDAIGKTFEKVFPKTLSKLSANLFSAYDVHMNADY